MAICRICGATCSEAELLDGLTDRGGCVSCAGSPRCTTCGHTRDEHTGTYGGPGVAGCTATLYDVPTLSFGLCQCAGFAGARA